MFALVRGVSDSFAKAVVRHAPASPIDVLRARAQHHAYVSALRNIGLSVIELPPLHSHPDACFVEDSAVVLRGVALIARVGALSRRGEQIAVGGELGRHLALENMHAPATLDGGDCMKVGDRLFIGRSSRTNDDGIARARQVFEPRGISVIAVDVTDRLHLKSVCSPLDDSRVLLQRGTIDPRHFAGCEVLQVDGDANVVTFQDRALVGSPETAARLEQAGLRTVVVDTSETRKADGALTCLSILFSVG